MNKFFAESQITDNENSFYAVYNKEKNCYQFSDMRSYIINMVKKDEITADDTDFVIIPVSVATETVNDVVYINDIVPYVETPTMAKLLLDKATIKFTFSKQTIIF